jgi:hypothetical protein
MGNGLRKSWLDQHDFPAGDHAMSEPQETIARCKCGREITNLRSYVDTQTATRFLTARCEACGEIALMLADQNPPAVLP